MALTTLKNGHVAVEGNEVHSASLVKAANNGRCACETGHCLDHQDYQEVPGQELLQYIDEHGNCQDVTSSDVNEHLKATTCKDITANDFRTWGIVLAAMA
jgi:DNA topoisomerase I